MQFNSTPLLEVKDLCISYRKGGIPSSIKGPVCAVKGVSFSVKPGETYAIVGESGSGKTSIAMSVIGFLRPLTGMIFFMNKNIWELDRSGLRRLRSNIQPVFQNSGASLNPRMSAGKIISEAFHAIVDEHEKEKVLIDLLRSVGLDREILRRFPHEISGGQKQRLNIARALALKPRLIILDEPLSSQDLSTRAQLIHLLSSFKKAYSLSYILISHNLSLVRLISDRIAIMKQGVFIEEGATEQIINNPSNNYTKVLIEASNIKNVKTG
jgi:ABC-type oligopeptide transport system ATPase subunit